MLPVGHGPGLGRARSPVRPRSRSPAIPGGSIARAKLLPRQGPSLRTGFDLHSGGSAGSLAHRVFCSPGGRIQGDGQVDLVRRPSLAVVGAVAGFQQVPCLQGSLRAMEERSGVLGPERHRFVFHTQTPSTLARYSSSPILGLLGRRNEGGPSCRDGCASVPGEPSAYGTVVSLGTMTVGAT
jgi:hypothetical protein